jgi:hypothetical protein
MGTQCIIADPIDPDIWQDFAVLNQEAIDNVNKPLTVSELAHTVYRMNKTASPGVFGLDIATLKLLLSN